jgi:hypothetical protein
VRLFAYQVNKTPSVYLINGAPEHFDDDIPVTDQPRSPLRDYAAQLIEEARKKIQEKNSYRGRQMTPRKSVWNHFCSAQADVGFAPER